MVTPVDPNEIRLTGENSFIKLRQQDDGPLTDRVTHWRGPALDRRTWTCAHHEKRGNG